MRSTLLTLALLPALAMSQPVTLTGDQWKRDLGILKRTLLEVHGGPLRRISRPEFDRHWAELERTLASGAKRTDGYLALSRFLHHLKDGHTYPNFFNQPATVKEELLGGRRFVPFTFRWLAGRMVVEESGRSGLARGEEIDRIQGVPTRRVEAELMKVARADGANDDKRRDWIRVTGIDGLEAFDVYFPLLFGDPVGSFRLRTRPPGATAWGEREVPARTLAERKLELPVTEPPSGPEDPLWTRSRPAPDVMRLDMPSWALYKSRWDWKGFLRQTFEELSRDKVGNLVIDLRANEGGNNVGADIIQYLIDTPWTPLPFDRILRFQKTPKDLDGYLSTWDDSFRDWTSRSRPRGDGTFQDFPPDEDSVVIQPASPRFRGRVFVLMSATNSSATFQFLTEAKAAKVATLIGQPSGGNRQGITGGSFFFLSLPESKIEVDIPLIGYFSRTPQPDAGVQPDVLVPLRAADIAAGRDAAWERVLREISPRR